MVHEDEDGGSRQDLDGKAIKGHCRKRELVAELKRLKQLTGLGHHLELCWRPDDDSDRHGEVRGNIIMIYDSVESEAQRTLRHEFIDYLISREIIEPYREITNSMIKLLNENAYKRKERVVEAVIRLLF